MPETSGPPPSKHTFVKTKVLLDDIFKVDEYRGTFELYNNTMSPEQRVIVFERGDSVAALLFDPYNREVVLIEQFRLPTLGRGNGGGWILEPAAGIVRDGETPRETMIRELREETGYQVNDLTQIATFFVSPGGTTERIFLFYAEVRRIQQESEGGGVKGEGEDIRLVRMPVAEFFAKLRNREFEDAKLIIAAQWLMAGHATMLVHDTAGHPPVERQLKQATTTPSLLTKLALGTRPPGHKYIGYYSGDILNVRGVDVWVNPLNTDMMLDRFTDRTISGVIRTLGAEKFPETNRIKVDTIGRELALAKGEREFVKPAKVIETSSGALLGLNGVKRIFHVATAKGEIGEDVYTDLDTLDHCVDNTLAAISRRKRYKSVLFPMLGTGQAGFSVNVVAPRLVKRAIEFFRDNSSTPIEKVYFLAYSEVDAAILADAIKKYESFFEAAAQKTP